ncbi:hypothetical protein [Novosphingobium sp. BW1]|uniref:hypothetical protein n=1 Tax=Novosphingobium sp. BW1 TaxID=2592621 RepID=UPI0011DED835|nr:hypothetical protein [Novosphingobium sp. BW1]TYC85158.1 hypothetical protein FMM79_18915 [Novosphingobium sp. BW1]
MQGIDVGRLIEQAPLSSLHKKIIVACAILLVVDGNDVFIHGAVLPRLMDEWGLSPTEAGSFASRPLRPAPHGPGLLRARLGLPHAARPQQPDARPLPADLHS